MPTPLLTLALDLPVSTLVLGQLLESRKIDVLKLGLWSLLNRPSDSTRTYKAFAQTLCPKLGIPIFWDFKLADTPDTNASVIKTLPKGGYVTVSTPLYLQADLMKLVALCKKQEVTPVAVSLTTATERQPLLPNITRNGFILSEIARVAESGFRHFVCDGSLLSHLQDMQIHTHVPGIRPQRYATAHNHKYTTLPSDAARLGAYNAIVGRPILDNKETCMMAALNNISQELHSTESTT